MNTPATYAELFDQIGHAYGLRLSIVNTGGGCYVAQGRLESGHWVVVTEADDFLSLDVQDRFDDEREYETTCGWYVGVYDNDSTDGPDQPADAEGCLTFTSATNARFSDLADVVGSVLRTLSAVTNRP